MSHVSLQEFLKTEPDGTLEVVAEQYNTTLLEVVRNLPSSTVVPGDKIRYCLGYRLRMGQRHHVSTYCRCHPRI